LNYYGSRLGIFFGRRVSGDPVTTVPLSFFVPDLAQAVPNTYLVYWCTEKRGKKDIKNNCFL
jgi:hypothetical protein